MPVIAKDLAFAKVESDESPSRPSQKQDPSRHRSRLRRGHGRSMTISPSSLQSRITTLRCRYGLNNCVSMGESEPVRPGGFMNFDRPNVYQFRPPNIHGGTILKILIVFAVVAVVWTTWFTVEPEETGVVLRFGRYVRTTEPGLHVKLPARREPSCRCRCSASSRRSSDSARRSPASGPQYDRRHVQRRVGDAHRRPQRRRRRVDRRSTGCPTPTSTSSRSAR